MINTYLMPSFELNIRKMYLVKMLSNMHFISAILVPFFTEWGGISFSQVLYLNAAFMFFVFMLEVPTGTIADFFGRKVSMQISCFVSCVAVLTYISYPDFYVFLAAEFIFAVGASLMSGADSAFIYDTLKELGRSQESKRIFGRTESFKLAGILIGAFFGSFIAKINLKAPFLFMAVPIGLAGLITFTLKEPSTFITEKKKSYGKTLLEGMSYFINKRELKILVLDMVLVGAMSWLVIYFYQVFLMGVNVDVKYFGSVHSAMALSQILIIQNFTGIEKLFGDKRTLLSLGAVVPGICFIIMGSVKNVPVLIAAIVLAAGFGLSRTPLFISYMNKYIPSDKRATVLSVTSMLRMITISIINILAALLSDWSIPWTIILFGCLLCVFPFTVRIKEDHLID